MKIFKYTLEVTDVQDVEMPSGAAVLTVQTQRETPCLWAEVEPKHKAAKRRFRIYGTGHEMDDRNLFPHYVGTFQLREGALVFHVYTDRVER